MIRGCSPLIGIAACLVLVIHSTALGGPADSPETVTAVVPLRVVNLPPGLRYPVFAGVPLPRGFVRDVRTCRLLEDGQPIPAQFESLAPWPDGSVKSVLVGAVVEADREYVLGLGPPAVGVGAAVAAGELPGDLSLVVQGTEYRVSRDRRRRTSVESSGPVRTVTRLLGKLTAADGTTSLGYLIRLFSYAPPVPFITLDLTVIDTRPENVRAPRRFDATAYGLEIPFPATGYIIGGQGNQVYLGELEGEAFLYQRGDSLFKDGWPNGFLMDYLGVGRGSKAPGWAAAVNQRDAVTVIVKDFWQQFPKELAVTPTALLIKLHPERASAEPPTPGSSHPRPKTFYFPREGGAKTYQVLVARTGDLDTVRLLNRAFQAGPRLVAPAAWYASTKVFGDLLPARAETAGYDALLMQGIYVPSFEPAMDAGGVAVTYGWRDFGDRLRSGNEGPVFYNDTHVGSHLYFTQYLRTLDDRWWWIAEKATRHWMDLDVSHTARRGHWLVSFGPGEGHLKHHEIRDHACRNLHPGHAHISGLPDYYLLTGDRRADDVMREVGDWWVRAIPWFYPLPVWGLHIAEAERDYAWPLFVVNEVYRATGDPKYLRAASHAVRHLIGWWQLPSTHRVGGQVVGRNDWRRGTGFWTMWPKSDNSAFGTNGTNPWMAGALLSAVIQFSEYDADTQFVNRDLVRRMLLQCMNYVVTWGYDPAGQGFYYSEGTRRNDGIHTHLLFPLAYLGRMVQRGVPDGERYDTADRWLEIARRVYEDYRVERWRGSQPSGFYGYECVWPADFWAIMKECSPSRRRQS